jgi:hypothetical protein
MGTSAVLIEVLSGDALTLSQAAALLPAARGSGRADRATIWRWTRVGRKNPAGKAVKLEAVRLGNWLTSRAAIARFAEELTGLPESPAASLADQRRATAGQEAAEQRLLAAGC